jgi:predicted RecB family endonuclease
MIKNNNGTFYKILVILSRINDWKIMTENAMNEIVTAFLKVSHNLLRTGMHRFSEVKIMTVRLHNNNIY